MDLSEPGSFRPISNLSFLSKILEKIVVGQLMPYLVESNLLPKFQSGYQSHHSTETLLVRLLSDIHTSIDNGEVYSSGSAGRISCVRLCGSQHPPSETPNIIWNQQSST